MTNTTGPQVGVTLYSFTNEWLTRQFELDSLLREVAARGLGPNIEIIGFQSFKEFPPRQKPGSFNLDRVMEAVTSGSKQ